MKTFGKRQKKMDKNRKNGVEKLNASNPKFPQMIFFNICTVLVLLYIFFFFFFFFWSFYRLLTVLLISMFVLLSGRQNCLGYLNYM